MGADGKSSVKYLGRQQLLKPYAYQTKRKTASADWQFLRVSLGEGVTETLVCPDQKRVDLQEWSLLSVFILCGFHENLPLEALVDDGV